MGLCVRLLSVEAGVMLAESQFIHLTRAFGAVKIRILQNNEHDI